MPTSFLDNTFSKLKIKNINSNEILSISHEMKKLNSLRFLVQETIYRYNETITKRKRYYSIIKTKPMYDGKTRCNLRFNGIDNKFTHLHFVETDEKKYYKEFYTCNDGYIIDKNIYESMIKEAILYKRIGNYL